MSARLLVVDDEQDVFDFVVPPLKDAGYEVITASDGVEALAKWRDDFPDLIVLDIKMPGMSGLDVLREIRQTDSTTPVVMLTSLDGLDDEVRAIKYRPNQYIAKSDWKLLRYWVGNLLEQLHYTTLECPNLKIDYNSMQVYVRCDDEWKEQHLEPTEREILFFLARRQGVVQTYETLNRRVLKKHPDESKQGLTKAVATLRKKIELNPADPKYIINVGRAGYRFDR